MNFSPKNIPNVLWYGERGIINAIVAHVSRSEDFESSIKCLLGAIEWGDGTSPTWIPLVIETHLVVEVGLADFGDPDLMIVCTTKSGTKHVVFLEAKALSYVESMQKTSSSAVAEWGMKQDGFNSSINGQLTLKYRFANALSVWDGGTSAITEQRCFFNAYQKRLNDSQRKSPGRSLAKGSVLDVVRRLGLAGISEDNCHYVALTWDCEAKAFFRSADVPLDCLPVFLTEDGGDRFASMLSRVGWLGYRQLEACFDLSQNAEYTSAFATMRETPEPELSFYTEQRRGRWETYPRKINELGEQLVRALESVRVQQVAGSYSIKDENNQTVGKIIPRLNAVFIGIREEYPPFRKLCEKLSPMQLCNQRVQRVNFIGLNVASVNEAEPIISQIRAVLSSLPEPAAVSDDESDPT